MSPCLLRAPSSPRMDVAGGAQKRTFGPAVEGGGLQSSAAGRPIPPARRPELADRAGDTDGRRGLSRRPPPRSEPTEARPHFFGRQVRAAVSTRSTAGGGPKAPMTSVLGST